jgi:putative DNA primase/helicase
MTTEMDTEKKYGPYSIKENYLYFTKKDKEGKTQTSKIGRLVRIKEVKQDVESQNVSLTLEYWFHNHMHEITISRKQLQTYEFSKLLEKGLDVPNFKSEQVLRFLAIQEESVPLTYTHRQLGWAVHEDQPYYKHHQAIGLTEKASTYEGEILLEPKGTFAQWLTIIQDEVLGKAELELALVFGLSAPVVGMLGDVLDLDTLAVHIYGKTTKGKTSAARVAVSAFGLPSTKKGGLIHTWNGTQNALIGKLADNKGLPMVYDEASMNHMKDFTAFIYLIAGGVEKLRMNKEAELKDRNTWSTTVLSTAEHSLLDKSNQNIGLKMRVFEFGNVTWTKDAGNADRLKEMLLENYGHAGTIFAQYLLHIGKDHVLEKWREWARRCYDSMPNVDTLSYRVSNKLALIMVTAELAKEALNLELHLEGILHLLIEQEQESVGSRHLGENAYSYFKQIIVQHRSKFEGQYFPEKAYECWGKISQQGANIEVAILTNQFKEIMKEGGFEDTQAVLKEWRDMGYLDHDKSKLTKKRVVFQESTHEEVNQTTKKRDFTYCIQIKENIFDLDSQEEGKVKQRPNPKTPSNTMKNILELD